MNDTHPSTLHDLSRRRFINQSLFLLSSLALPHIARGDSPPVTAGGLTQAPREAAQTFADPAWLRDAIRLMWAERKRSGVRPPLLHLSPPFNKDLHLYLKHEAKTPIGSLKLRKEAVGIRRQRRHRRAPGVVAVTLQGNSLCSVLAVSHGGSVDSLSGLGGFQLDLPLQF